MPQVKTILECWAPWCGASRRMALALAALSAELEPQTALRRINADEAPEALGEYHVRVLPTLLFLDEHDCEVARLEGECGVFDVRLICAATQ
ncbi:MAG: thioredoxin family protein [Oscillospiraceae bacterium]|jgi:thioredoxin 1|nr:thioredoxin family protein [Oscillospiraceae bacterium]